MVKGIGSNSNIWREGGVKMERFPEHSEAYRAAILAVRKLELITKLYVAYQRDTE